MSKFVPSFFKINFSVVADSAEALSFNCSKLIASRLFVAFFQISYFVII